ncbi:MAG: pilus assembly protein N-terminal domain-containing protein [candidate division FCPU426 bacterium]
MKWIAVLSVFLAQNAFAAERITLYAGESRIVPAEKPIKTLIGNRQVADARVLSDSEILINGKQAGITSLVLLGQGDQRTTYELEVTSSDLKQEMIEVDVQVLEIADASGWDVGIDWPALMNGQIGAPGLATQPLQLLEQPAPPLKAFGTFSRGPINLALQALVQKNKAKLLAKPKLLTISGGSAKFLSGGQIPVAHQDTQGHSNTEYKDYGVALSVQPKSDREGNIRVTLRAEVSNIDGANSISMAGGILPALKTRWVDTTVYVKKNGTIVIAGMIQDEERKVTRGLPLLSSIPLLGELFKTHSSVKSTTELVIFITPRVIDPS